MSLINVQEYISEFDRIRNVCGDFAPWMLCAQADHIVQQLSAELGSDYVRDGKIFVHQSATLEQGVIMKGPVMIGKDCFVAAHSEASFLYEHSLKS